MFSDDDDFNPKAGSKLASLFGSSSKSNSAEHPFDACKTGPQVPSTGGPVNKTIGNATASSSGSPSSLKLICVKVVQAFIFKDNKYEPYGKLAAALLGNNILKHYQIILYRNKKDHVTKSYISGIYWFGVQGNNYASFYDHNNTVWTIMFDTTSDFAEFCTEVALSKYMVSLNEDQIAVQDVISLSTGKSVKQYDSVKLDYVIQSLDDQYRPSKESIIKGSNYFYLAMKDEWEKCLIDCVENSRRLLILPQIHAGIWEKIVGKSCLYGLLLDLTVRSATDRLPRDQLPRDHKLQNIEMMLPKLPSNDDSTVTIDESVKKNDNFSESSMENMSPKKKSDLIVRMGRLGRAALPVMPGRVPNAVDSDDTEEDTSSAHSASVNRNIGKSKLPQKAKHKPVQPSPLQYSQQPFMPSYSQHQFMPNAVIGYPGLTSFTPSGMSPIVDSQLPILFSEIRTNNSELRMGLNSVTDKVEKLMDTIQTDPSYQVLQHLEHVDSEIKNRISSLAQQNTDMQKYNLKTESNADMTELVIDIGTGNITEIKKENDVLIDSLAETKRLIEEIQGNISNCITEKSEVENQLSAENREIANLRKELMGDGLRPYHESTDLFSEKIKSSFENLTTKVESLQKSLDGLNLNVENNSLTLVTGDNETEALEVRDNMNNLYKLMKSQFKPGSSYSSSEIYDKFSSILKNYC